MSDEMSREEEIEHAQRIICEAIERRFAELIPHSLEHYACKLAKNTLRRTIDQLMSMPPKSDETVIPPREQESWKGYWHNWIAPFHACPRCGQSLDWQRTQDALERPLIRASCCGIHFTALMEWEAPAVRAESALSVGRVKEEHEHGAGAKE